MKTKTLLIGCMAALCMWSCSSKDDVIDIDKPYEPKPEEPVTRHSYTPVQLNETQQAINAKLQEFSWKLFKEVYAINDATKNLMISPISLEIDLGMFQNGIEGKTLEKLLKTQGLDGFKVDEVNDYYKTMITGIAQADDRVTFTSANSLWYHNEYSVADNFKSAIENNYAAKVASADFSDSKTRNMINSWCSDNTGDRIKEMITALCPEDLFHLLNAVYFKGSWLFEFDKSQTKKDEFKTANGNIKEVDMMYKQFSSISYSDAGDFETIVLPFSSPGFMFFAMLPKEDVKMDDAIINSLSPASINSLSTAKGYLYMPKYEVEYEMAALVEVLQAINPELAFNQDEITFLNTKVNDVNILQKTFFKVDEEGVEAAAVTDMSNTYFDNPDNSKIVELRFNRPFVYGIMEASTNMPLFIGYYGN